MTTAAPTSSITTDPSRNIHQRLAAVMAEVGYIKRDKSVSTGGSGAYNAVTHDMVTAVVRPHFIAVGVIIVPRLVEAKTVDTGRKTSGGTPVIRVEARYDVDFVNIDRPDEKVTVPTYAHADDTGDKAPGKCLSYAVKGAVLKVLMIETGDDDEGRVAPTREYNEAELAVLAKLREESLKGYTALKAAWQKLDPDTRDNLRDELDGLKDAATKAGT